MKDVSPAATYACLLPDLVAAARDVGYALAPHGSFGRDLDLIAVPWTEEATSAEQLILALLGACGGHIVDGHTKKPDSDEWEKKRGGIPTQKPHGRRAWSIHIGNHGSLYLDVSVMPLAGKP